MYTKLVIVVNSVVDELVSQEKIQIFSIFQHLLFAYFSKLVATAEQNLGIHIDLRTFLQLCKIHHRNSFVKLSLNLSFYARE